MDAEKLNDIVELVKASTRLAELRHPEFGANPLAVLVEEVGEVARAMQEGEQRLEDEILDIVAVCVRWIGRIEHGR